MNNCIVVDVCNVLADSIGRVLEIVNERYRTNYIKDDIRSPKLVGSGKLAPSGNILYSERVLEELEAN